MQVQSNPHFGQLYAVDGLCPEIKDWFEAIRADRLPVSEEHLSSVDSTQKTLHRGIKALGAIGYDIYVPGKSNLIYAELRNKQGDLEAFISDGGSRVLTTIYKWIKKYLD